MKDSILHIPIFIVIDEVERMCCLSRNVYFSDLSCSCALGNDCLFFLFTVRFVQEFLPTVCLLSQLSLLPFLLLEDDGNMCLSANHED